jgi:folate-binding Fe-S cluster repair protein YgfZ
VARLRHRGRANRGLRLLEIESDELPTYDAELLHDGKAVGRVTSAVRDGERVIALAYVRREVPEDAELDVDRALARPIERQIFTTRSPGTTS